MFRAYLARRKADAQAAKDRGKGAKKRAGEAEHDRPTADARHVYGSGKKANTTTDPSHPSRRKRHRSFVTLTKHFWAMLSPAAGTGGSGKILQSKRAVVLFGIITVVLSALGALALPASTKLALDYVLTDHPGPRGLPSWLREYDRLTLLWMLGGGITALNVFSLLIGMAGRWRMTRLAQHVRTNLRRRVFEHAVRLPLQRVYALKTGGAASLLREDSGQTADLLFGILYNPVRALVQLVGTLVILASVDWMLLVGAVLLIPAAWLSQKTWISRIRPVHRESHQLRQNIDAATTEVFGGMRVVRGFARERKEAARFARSTHLLARQEVLIWWWSRAVEIAWQILIPLGSVAVLIYGGSRVINGSLTIGDVMMFSAYLIMLLGPLEMLSQSATGIQSQLAAFDRILDLLEEPREFQGGGSVSPGRLWAAREHTTGVALDTGAVEGRIELRRVSFSYPGTKQGVLSEISLNIAPGETVALVGPSGAGKTTLCNLVAHFYDPTSGVIELDGRDLRSIDVRSYRSLLGIVEQDVFLFDGTVRENIAYASRGASREQVSAAARAANADEFISKLEFGYDTLVGERGVRLSGGQKQRIAIARALLADPRILILDEATSNLDTLSEQLIQESLGKLMQGRTCLVIAHRLSTIRSAHRIAVIEDGRIVEIGPHETLMAQSGRYAEMVARQTGAMSPSPGGSDRGLGVGSPATGMGMV